MSLLAKVREWLVNEKCRFTDVCPWFNPKNPHPTCTKWGGHYYGFGKYAGCYRRMEARYGSIRKLKRGEP